MHITRTAKVNRKSKQIISGGYLYGGRAVEVHRVRVDGEWYDIEPAIITANDSLEVEL